MSFPDPNSIESIRKRPAMYVGSTEFFGLIQYLVSAVNLHLAGRPSYVAISKEGAAFVVQSDAQLKISEDNGVLLPFERIERDPLTQRTGYDGSILNALSQSLSIEATSSSMRRMLLQYRSGVRVERQDVATGESHRLLKFTFVPDSSIFTIESVSAYNFHSYLKRLSYLYPGVRFRFTAGGQSEEFHSLKGIVDLFESVAGPYQLLHEPIHFRATEDDLDLELIFAFHSWSDNWLWSFINRGRAVLGGTHERGLASGLRAFRSKLNRSVRTYPFVTGSSA